MRYWEVIADKLHKNGWSWGCCIVVTSNRRVLFIIDAHRGDGRRFVASSDEKLSAFLELERVLRAVPKA
jgi:hypothetical protein